MADEKPTLDYEPKAAERRLSRWITIIVIGGWFLLVITFLIAWGSLIVSGLAKP